MPVILNNRHYSVQGSGNHKVIYTEGDKKKQKKNYKSFLYSKNLLNRPVIHLIALETTRLPP